MIMEEKTILRLIHPRALSKRDIIQMWIIRRTNHIISQIIPKAINLNHQGNQESISSHMIIKI
jgi:hypothetical protein